MEPLKKGNWKKRQLLWLGLFIFLLTALQKFRINIGPMPLYFAEALLAVLLFKTSRYEKLHWPKSSRRILFLAKFFFICVILGEISGAISSNYILPAGYQIARYGLGISLLFVLPRLVKTQQHFQVVLKALVVGMLITGSLSLFSSLPPTRPLAKYAFSKLNPTGDRGLVKKGELRGEETAIRGTSLVGPATVTGGYLCALWPLGLLAYRRIDSNKKWKRLALLACIITPIGALATYSRMAWLGVFLIIGLIGLFGFSGSRRMIIIFGVLLTIIVSQVGIYSRFFFIDRIERRTAATIDNPMEAEGERFLSFIHPFKHLIKNPSWLLAGSGSAASKMRERRRAQLSAKRVSINLLPSRRFESSTPYYAHHSAFATAYYYYGLPGAISHVFLVLLTLALILQNLRYSKRNQPEERLTWQALFAVWFGMLPWLLFGHAATSTARGSMFFFFILAIILTCEQLRLKSESST